MIVLYPGSFDPPHLGHLDLIRRAAQHVERLIVGVAENPAKRPLLPVAERLALLREACAPLASVEVVAYAGATAAYARARGATALLRGLRHGLDLEQERGVATWNRVAGGLETWFLLGDGAHAHLSSSLVREALAAGMPIEGLVDARTAARLAAIPRG